MSTHTVCGSLRKDGLSMTSIIGVNLRRLGVYITTPLGPSHTIGKNSHLLGADESVEDYENYCVCVFVRLVRACVRATGQARWLWCGLELV